MDERTIELIHGDLDGQLGPDERRELHILLEASDEARREHERVRALHETLGSLAEVELPPGLRDSILAAVAQPTVATDTVATDHAFGRRRRARLGLVAALAATAAGVALVLDRSPGLQELDPSVLAGTIGQMADDRIQPALRLDEQAVSGRMTLHRRGSDLVIDVDLESDRPIEITARADAGTLVLEGFVRLDGKPSRLDAVDGRIRFVHSGGQHYALVLVNEGDAASVIEVAVYDGDRLIRDGRLNVPATRDHHRN
jgi:hypothetical protein